MSELVPEVNDIWEDTYRKTETIIIEKEENYIFYLTRSKGIIGTGYFTESCFDDEYFLSRHTYRGKSKANISQLFEVQDDKSQEKN